MSSDVGRMKSAIAKAFDKRKFARIPIQLKVDVESPNSHYLFEYSTNLSQNGIFIQTMEPELPGTLIILQFSLPNNHVIRTRGEVMWVNSVDAEEDEPGMGIKFLGISNEDRDSILAALKKVAIL
jgi:uncharacterized protein (TIGR02266 family)